MDNVLESTKSLLAELRNGALSPKDYYEVYILVLSESRLLDATECIV